MRHAILAALLNILTWLFLCHVCAAQQEPAEPINLAVVATPSTSYVSGHETLAAINDGFDPRNSNDRRHGQYANWPRRGLQWVQYEWQQPISTNKIDVYWWDDRRGVRLPQAAGQRDHCRAAQDSGHWLEQTRGDVTRGGWNTL